MKARNVISGWPQGTSSSKPYPRNQAWWIPYLRNWSQVDRTKIVLEQAMEKEYRDGQNRMMDEWRTKTGRFSPPGRRDFPIAGFNIEKLQKAYGEAKFGAEADVPDEYYFDLSNAGSSIDGRHYYEPLEDHTAPTYGGISRDKFPAAANWKFDADDPTVLTLDKLTKQLESLPKFPRMPPHYRCHPSTYQNLATYLSNRPERPDWLPDWINFAGVQIVPDPAVTPGKFWPPEGWEP